ncbi:MAG TPA: haloacid dehalogenase [Acidimicrobiia bacterium]|nr:haloacid dehalogenase [Acidimicrobiia bacterium]
MTIDRSAELVAAGEEARTILDEKHRAREITYNASRRAIRACASAIRAVHRREFLTARELIAEAAAFLAEADAAIDGHHDVRYGGSLHDAKKEFAEANLTLAFVSGHPIPGAEELRVETPAYLNGMAEAASELRRQVLDCLRRGELQQAEDLLSVMDDVYTLLVTIDYPEALTGGLRRASDALRAVLERTRGDVTNALVMARMQDAIGGESTEPAR